MTVTELEKAQIQINDALLSDGNPKAYGMALLAQQLLNIVRGVRS